MSHVAEVRYGTHERNVLDVYAKVVARDAPAVMFVHGGAFMLCSKEDVKDTCEALADAGFVVFAPSYRLGFVDAGTIQRLMFVQLTLIASLCYNGSAKVHVLLVCMFVLLVITVAGYAIQAYGESVAHPAQVCDLAKCLAWIVANAETYGASNKKIVVMGHSAGGHLVALLANNRRFLRGENVPDDAIKGVISLSGVYSDARLAETFVGRSLLTSVFGGRVADDVGKKRKNYDAFPIYHCNQLSPPHLLLNAEADISLRSHAWDFFHALKQQQIQVWAKVVKGDHFSIRKGLSGTNTETMDYIKDFVKRVCG